MKPDALQRMGAVTVFVVGLGLLVPRVAPADEAEERKAEAQRLFMAGQAALEKGDNPTACTLMRQSLGLFAVANTLFNVAKCDEADGKLNLALEHWRRGLTLIDPTDKRTPVVQKSIETLEPKIPRVRVVIPAKSKPLSVLLDDEEVSEANLEKPLWVDPGKHVIVVRKAGRKDKRVELLLAEKERTEVVAEPGEPEGGVVPVPTASASVTPPPPPPPGSGLRTGGFVALGVGGVGVIGAVVTGVMVLGNKDKLLEGCPEGVCPNQAALDAKQPLIEEQQTLKALNGVFWGLGIVGAGAGVAMLVLSSGSGKQGTNKAQIVPIVSPSVAGIGLSGRF